MPVPHMGWNDLVIRRRPIRCSTGCAPGTTRISCTPNAMKVTKPRNSRPSSITPARSQRLWGEEKFAPSFPTREKPEAPLRPDRELPAVGRLRPCASIWMAWVWASA